MQKVIIIGCPGSGKSTFARAVQEKTGLPLYYLDRMYWNADKTIVPRPVFLGRLQEAMSGERWIIDGNYGSTMELRMLVCDTVFFLDYPAEVCLKGIEDRKGKQRPDMPWVENEGEEDEEFCDFVRKYNEESRPQVVALLEKYRDKDIVIFRSREEADGYLEGLAK